ncbi:MAG: reprolysin-like metallopeptidase, partial [Bacteroidota bacterium]
MKISTYFLLGALVLCFCSLDAQTDPWLALPSTDNFPGADRRIVPNKYVSYRADTTVLKDLLWAAPHERNVSAPQSELEIQLPNPDGEIESFHIVAYDMMEPALQEAWWYIRTWRGVSSTNPRVTIRLDWTDRGFHAMVRGGEGGSWFIDPLYWDHRDVYQAYYKNDYPAPERPFECHTEHGDIKPGFRPVNPGRAGDCQLRQYRTAVATTGEYTAFHGGTVAGAASAIATTMNRVNGVYEEDLALRCILIANNNSIIYLNPATDPYSNGDGVAMLGENQTNLDNVIGTANYDIGHVFSTGGGGVASLRSPCNSARKARGVTGQGSPVGDPFDIDYVAHEMGHQFGGNHTQNNSCQRSSASMEPGSASSIMGYAGICNPNVQSNSDDYFHGVNIQEIANYMETGGGNSCATIIDMSNGEPTVMMGDDYDIPGGTPFVLSADASDPNGDPLTYCWEQYDNEVGEDMPPLATNTQGPLFRTFDPTSSPERYFPRLSDLVNNIDPTWETLPETNRDMEFRVTIRDFDGTYGCTTEDNIILSVDASAGPFLVTEPNTNVTWFEGSQATVTWDVAGTNSAPISCSDVDILLSYDGGFTYPVVLQGGTANDGSENITVPNGTSSTARVMVRCSDNVFFDISNVNFDIDPASAPDFTITYNDGAVQACEGTNGSLDFVVNTASIAGFNDPITLSAISSPLGVNVAFSANPVNPGDAVTVTVSNFSSLAAGSYMVTVEGSSTSGDKTVDLPFVLIDAAGASALISPFDGEIDVDIFPTLDWDPGANADSYFIEVSDAISFSNIIASGTVSDTEFTINAPLSAETVYYWRVQSINTECGAGNTSVVNSFETAPCYYYTFSGNV